MTTSNKQGFCILRASTDAVPGFLLITSEKKTVAEAAVRYYALLGTELCQSVYSPTGCSGVKRVATEDLRRKRCSICIQQDYSALQADAPQVHIPDYMSSATFILAKAADSA